MRSFIWVDGDVEHVVMGPRVLIERIIKLREALWTISGGGEHLAPDDLADHLRYVARKALLRAGVMDWF